MCPECVISAMDDPHRKEDTKIESASFKEWTAAIEGLEERPQQQQTSLEEKSRN
jgi:hypothetical protein